MPTGRPGQIRCRASWFRDGSDERFPGECVKRHEGSASWAPTGQSRAGRPGEPRRVRTTAELSLRGWRESLQNARFRSSLTKLQVVKRGQGPWTDPGGGTAKRTAVTARQR